eukprot:2206312-Pleurochrysis_carterae.AAC.1
MLSDQDTEAQYGFVGADMCCMRLRYTYCPTIPETRFSSLETEDFILHVGEEAIQTFDAPSFGPDAHASLRGFRPESLMTRPEPVAECRKACRVPSRASAVAAAAAAAAHTQWMPLRCRMDGRVRLGALRKLQYWYVYVVDEFTILIRDLLLLASYRMLEGGPHSPAVMQSNRAGADKRSKVRAETARALSASGAGGERA